MKYEIEAGISIEQASQKLCRMADEHGEVVESAFNDTPVSASPGEDPHAVEKRFWDARREAERERTTRATLIAEELDSALDWAFECIKQARHRNEPALRAALHWLILSARIAHDLMGETCSTCVSGDGSFGDSRAEPLLAHNLLMQRKS